MRTPPLHPNMATTSCARRHRVQTRPQHHPHAAPASKHGHNIMRTPPLHPNMATTSSARRHCVQTRPQHHPHVAPASKHGHNIIHTSKHGDNISHSSVLIVLNDVPIIEHIFRPILSLFFSHSLT
jgi:hypothetical protein